MKECSIMLINQNYDELAKTAVLGNAKTNSMAYY